MNILENVKENEFHQKNKIKKATSIKSGGHQIQMNIGIVYNQVIRMLEDNRTEFRLPLDGVKTAEKLQLLKQTVQYFILQNMKLSEGKKGKENVQNILADQSNIISCVDCQNYENNLQKLQNDVRQHIRLQQQLKIYQQGMQQKIEELKKQKVLIEKKYQQSKKKVEELRNNSSSNGQKVHKLEYENQKLKSELKHLKQGTLDNSKKIKGYESKQNKLDWVQRMSSIKKQEKDKTDRTDRKSIEKKGDSSDRWRMSNTRSTKILQINDKIIQDKNRKDREKAIQSKFQYRR